MHIVPDQLKHQITTPSEPVYIQHLSVLINTLIPPRHLSLLCQLPYSSFHKHLSLCTIVYVVHTHQTFPPRHHYYHSPTKAPPQLHQLTTTATPATPEPNTTSTKMAPSNSAYSTRSLRQSLPELSISSSTRPSTTSSRFPLSYSSHPSSSQDYAPVPRSSRRYASPSASSSASGSSRGYDIPPPNYHYTPSNNRDHEPKEYRSAPRTTSSRSKQYLEPPKVRVINNSDRGCTDPYAYSKGDDGRYYREPSSKSGSSGYDKEKVIAKEIAREKAWEAEKKINGKGKGKDKRREPEVRYNN